MVSGVISDQQDDVQTSLASAIFHYTGAVSIKTYIYCLFKNWRDSQFEISASVFYKDAIISVARYHFRRLL